MSREKRCAVVDSTRLMNIFKRCGEVLNEASQIERARILAALNIVFEPESSVCPPDRRVMARGRRTPRATNVTKGK